MRSKNGVGSEVCIPKLLPVLIDVLACDVNFSVVSMPVAMTVNAGKMYRRERVWVLLATDCSGSQNCADLLSFDSAKES